MDAFEQSLAVRTCWGEARGEGQAGMAAVGHVILNRLATKRWGNTIGTVCLWPYQFSCWNFTDSNRLKMLNFAVDSPELVPASAAFLLAWTDHKREVDPTAGATFYKVVGTPANWATGYSPCAVLGRHEFFKGIP